MLLRLQLVAHPGQGGARLQRTVLGQEVRVVPARAVDGGEGAQHHAPHARGRGRGQEVQGPDRLQLVRVAGVAARVREERGVDDGLHLLLAEQLEQALVGGRLGEVERAVADAERGRGRGDVDGDEALGRADLGQPPQHTRPEQRRDARDRGAAQASRRRRLRGAGGAALRVFFRAARGARRRRPPACRFASASSRSSASMRATARLNSVRVGTFMVRRACATAWSTHSLPRTAACMAWMKRGLLMSSFETWVKNSSPRARRKSNTPRCAVTGDSFPGGLPGAS